MSLGYKGYGIHGTNSPKSIGKAASHGCIRMHTKDAEELFDLVKVGDAVELHGERDDAIAKLLPETPAPSTSSPAPAPVITASVSNRDHESAAAKQAGGGQ
jgi:hypothetical protein